jgi:hypothetical protein
MKKKTVLLAAPKIAKLLKIVGMLLQTKVYLFGINVGVFLRTKINCSFLISSKTETNLES